MSGALAIILARAGSKGVPGKNRAPVAGKPCVLWTIEHALAAERVGRVLVSSDDPEVLAIASRAGAQTLKRPPDLARDAATIDDAARHAANSGSETSLVILYANVPVRPRGLIDAALLRLEESGADSVQSYCPVGKHHPYWTVRVNPLDGHVCPWEGTTLYHGIYRRQDLPPAFVPDGGVIALTRRALFGEIPDVAPGPHAFLGRTRRAVMTREGDVVDIDSPIDLHVANAILSTR